MNGKVFITKIAKFLPNNPVSNDEMEDYLGKIRGLRSKTKNLILRNNGIKCRYYALEKGGKSTHTNTELTVEAIKKLEDGNFKVRDIQLLTCGTVSPDVMLPGHACMVQGKLDIGAIDVMTATGSCNGSMWGLNYAWMSILTGKYTNAVCTGSEKLSSWMLAQNFEEESKYLEELGKNPYVAFEKEFLRWMLSDGAAAVLLEDKPNKNGLSYQINWIEIRSYSNILESCMYAGGIKKEDGDLIPWREIDPTRLINETVFSLKQDSRLLEKHITDLGGEFLSDLIKKKNLKMSEIDYFLPHMSSEFFRGKIKASMEKYNIDIADEKWFTNLEKIGNIGSASGFMMLEELLYSGKLKKGDKVLVMIPESARFSYTYAHFTVV